MAVTYYQDLAPDPQGYAQGYQTSSDLINWTPVYYALGTFGPGTPSAGSAQYTVGSNYDGSGGVDGLGGSVVSVAENDPVSAAWKWLAATGRKGVFAPGFLRIVEYS